MLDHSHTRVILIGNSEYPNYPQLDIKNINVNLEKLRNVFCNPDFVGIKDDPDFFLELNNKGVVDIQIQIEDFVSKCTPDDNLFLYYAGHGLLDIADVTKVYLATADTKIDRKKFTCIPSDEIKGQLLSCKAKNKIMILDCCYAGKLAGLQSDIESVRLSHWGETTGVYFMMSSDKDTPSRFDPENNTIPTFFTQKLVDTIQEGSNVSEDIWTLDRFFEVMSANWNVSIAPQPRKLSYGSIGEMQFCYNQYKKRLQQNKKTTTEEQTWLEIESDPDVDKLSAFIEECNDSALVEKALSLWAQMENQYAKLKEALEKGTTDALAEFIREFKPVKKIKKIAVDHMKQITTTRNSSLNSPSTSAGPAEASRNIPGGISVNLKSRAS